MRIIAGTHRGRRLESLKGEATRPTASRTRESLFNLLQHHAGLKEAGFSGLPGAHVADIFCGTGALGLEALSRGAASASFVDNNRAAIRLTEANIAALKLQEQAQCFCCPAASLPAPPHAHRIALLDPPYHSNLLEPALSALQGRGWLENGAILAIETAQDEQPIFSEPYHLIDSRRYGAARVWLVQHHPNC